MRFFNTAGPCIEGHHYMLPPIERLPEAPKLIQRGMYFVVHAPRQTGKTTTLMALARELTKAGRYAALHVTCEIGKTAADDVAVAQHGLIEFIQEEARAELPQALWPPAESPAQSELHVLGSFLRAWAQHSPRPLVLFFDEIDALRGDSLMSVLSQLRARYPKRPKHAPWSVVLCGLRDVRDYKAASGGDPSRLGTASPFNIKVKSLRLGDFRAHDIAKIYAQHTEDTGQPFTADAIAHAFSLTQGQPWLVNALAYEITEEMQIEPPIAITGAHVEAAKERLILARATHLDSLVDKLQEDSVRRVIAPVMAGVASIPGDTYNDDVSYARDLGLIAPTRPLRVANPIYREVIARVLAAKVEDVITTPPRRFIAADGRIDMDVVLRLFADFWRQHGEVLTGDLSYHEVAPQLVLMAYLQSIVNGTGFIDREYGIGRGRIDLCIRWPYVGPDGDNAWQREAIELKVWRDKQRDPCQQGLDELDDYLDGLGLDTGVLVIFDRRMDRPGARATGDDSAGRVPALVALSAVATPRGRTVTLLRA